MRKPLDQAAYPVNRTLGVGDADLCSALPILRAQYFAMLGGQTTSQVRDGDRWQSFHPGNAAALKREITRLELLCSYAGQPRAVRAGPQRPLYGFGSGYAAPYRY